MPARRRPEPSPSGARALLIAACAALAFLSPGASARADAPWSYRAVSDHFEVAWLVAPTAPAASAERAASAVHVLRSGGALAAPAVQKPTPWDRAEATRLGAVVPPTHRGATLWARSTFHIGDELAALRILRLRVLYQDGLLIYINGVEVARRNTSNTPWVPPGAAFAERARGEEWETFYIEVYPGLLRAGPNVLAFEVRPGSARRMPVLRAELEGLGQSGVVRGPLLRDVTTTSARIVFDTAAPAQAHVLWGRAPGMLDQVAASRASKPSTQHSVTIQGLSPDRPIYYRVATATGTSQELSFSPVPSAGEIVTFIVYGDTRTGHVAHAAMIDRLRTEGPDFVVQTGDLVMRGSDEADWQRFFDIAGSLLGSIPFVAATGNHDQGIAGPRAQRFSDMFADSGRPADQPDESAWHSVTLGDVHFIMLDSNHYADPRQAAWLTKDLDSARRRGARALFAITHHGPLSMGPHGGHPLAARLVPALVAGGVAAIFAGHDHLYQRSQLDGLSVIVTGGGGAPLYQPRCGGSPRKVCRDADGGLAVSAYHYVAVTVYRDYAQLCPKLLDGSALEPCFNLDLVAPRERSRAASDPETP